MKIIEESDFAKLIKWYNYCNKLKNEIEHSSKVSSLKEYILMSSTWIQNFENIFNYQNLKQNFKEKRISEYDASASELKIN